MFLSRACLSWALAMAKTSTPGCIYYFASYQSLPAAARYRTTVYRVQNSFPKIDPGGHTPSSRLPPLRNGRVVVCVCVLKQKHYYLGIATPSLQSEPNRTLHTSSVPNRHAGRCLSASASRNLCLFTPTIVGALAFFLFLSDEIGWRTERTGKILASCLFHLLGDAL